MSKHSVIVPILTAAVTLAAIVALHPTVQVAHDALIVNTTISSAIVDNHGAAIAVAPFACGIDTTVWCDIADSLNANS